MGFIIDMSDDAGPFSVESRRESFYLYGEHNFDVVGTDEDEEALYDYVLKPDSINISKEDDKVTCFIREEKLANLLAALDDLCDYLDEDGTQW